MYRNNLENIKLLVKTREGKDKVSLILKIEEVPYPYYENESDFEIVLDLLNNTCNKIKSDFISPFHAL